MTSEAKASFDATLAELVGRLGDVAPGLILLRYSHEHTPRVLEQALHQAHPGTRCVHVPYRTGAWEGAEGSVSHVVATARREAALPPPPVVFLVPDAPGDAVPDPSQRSDFWKRLNSQREVLGELNARIVLAIGPADDPYAHAHALDLISWCIPKLELQGPPPASAEPLRLMDMELRPGRPAPIGNDASLHHLSLMPLWKEIAAGQAPITPAQVQNIGLPLVEGILDEGRVGEAGTLLTAMEHVNLPPFLKGMVLAQRGRFHQLRGQGPEAALAFDLALQTLKDEERRRPDDPQVLRLSGLALLLSAEFLVQRGQPGDADLALRHHQHALDLSERLLAANPDSAQALRDVSGCLKRLAHQLATRGLPEDADIAHGHFQRAWQISERLLAANPSSVLALRDVADSLSKLAGFLARRGHDGDQDLALRHDQRSLYLLERVAEASPLSGRVLRDVAATLLNLAELLLQRQQPGDADKAVAHCHRALEIFRRLLAAEPASAQALRDVSVAEARLADSLVTRAFKGDAEKALEHYQESLSLNKRLLAANPDSAKALRDVSVSHFKLFQFHWQLGDSQAAEANLAQCFAMVDSFAQQGRPMDSQMRGLHEQLKALFPRP